MEQIFRSYLKHKSNKENNNVSVRKIVIRKKCERHYDSIVKLVDNDDNKQIIIKQNRR